MANISLSFTNVSTEEARTAAWALGKANEERVAAELTPYANITEMIEDHIISNMLPSWQQAEATESLATQMRDAWPDATDAQRAAALAALTS